jgi:hypothetical protein
MAICKFFAKIVIMATREQIKTAEEAKKWGTAKAVTGFVASAGTEAVQKGVASAGGGTTGGGWGTFVSLVGNLGIAAWQYVSGKKFQKSMTAEQEAIAKAHGTVDEKLEAIQLTGFNLIEQGMKPGTTAFENEMVKQLYDTVGYKGQCNIDAWAPEEKKKKGQRTKRGSQRRVQFYVRGNGTSLKPGAGFKPHPYLQSYWSAQCRNIRDSWVEAYQGKLVEEGRFRELEELQSSLKKGTKIARIALGGTALVLLIIMVRYSMKMET